MACFLHFLSTLVSWENVTFISWTGGNFGYSLTHLFYIQFKP